MAAIDIYLTKKKAAFLFASVNRFIRFVEKSVKINMCVKVDQMVILKKSPNTVKQNINSSE